MAWLAAAALLVGCTSAGARLDGGAADGGALRDGGSLPDGGALVDGGMLPDGGADAGASRCGTRGAGPCASDEWCDFPDSACGAADVGGTCQKRPTACTQDCPGVCGCDGRFYCNGCEAHAAGVDESGESGCQGAPCAGDGQCSGGLKCCYPCGIPGCQNRCTTPADGGECPLVP
jgi:hypothetical protein